MSCNYICSDAAAMIQSRVTIQRMTRMKMYRLQPKALGRGRISIGEGGPKMRLAIEMYSYS